MMGTGTSKVEMGMAARTKLSRFRFQSDAAMTSLIVMLLCFAGYVLYWRVMISLLNSPFVTIQIPSIFLPQTSGANLNDIIFPYDYVNTVFTHYLYGVIPLYNSIYGDLMFYHFSFLGYLAVAGGAAYEASKRRDWWGIIKKLWIIFGVIWYLFLLANLTGSNNAIVSLGQITFLAQTALAIATAIYVAKRLLTSNRVKF